MSDDSRVPVSNIVRRKPEGRAGEMGRAGATFTPALFLLEKEPTFWRFVSNLAACLSAPPQDVSRRSWMYASMFRSAFLRRGDPSRGLLLSALLHVIAVTTIISAPLYDFGSEDRWFQPPEMLPPEHEVVYYNPADLLPRISPPKPKTTERPKSRPAPKNTTVKVAFQPAQKILSKPPVPDNRRQTIVQPELPRMAQLAEVRVPNMIRWDAPNLPAPAVPTEIRRPAPKPAPESPPVERNVPALPLPQSIQADASTISTLTEPTVKAPKLPVPVRIMKAQPLITAEAQQPGERLSSLAPEVPTAPAGRVDVVAPQEIGIASLIAISLAPAPPADELVIPSGNRSGEFSASPEGSGEESNGIPVSGGAIASTGTGEPELPGDEDAQIRVPGLSISGVDPGIESSSPGGTKAGTDLRQLMASLSRPKLTPTPGASSRYPGSPKFEGGTMAVDFFGARRVYTVHMNMPNLTSAAGSWVLRFAEMGPRESLQEEAGELSTPEAIRKVDPKYVASAAREHVQGMVTLAAVVLRDGTLANIRVVGSLDPRLDSSAVAALTQWRFRPAHKNGVPVELEVLVQIPFLISSL